MNFKFAERYISSFIKTNSAHVNPYMVRKKNMLINTSRWFGLQCKKSYSCKCTINKTFLKITSSGSNIVYHKNLPICLDFSFIQCFRTLHTSTTHNNDNDKTISHLFTPLPVTATMEEEDCHGTELVGALEIKKVKSLLLRFNNDSLIKKLAEEKGMDDYIFQEAFNSFRKYCLSGENLPTDLHIVLHDLCNDSGHIHDIYPYFLRHSEKVFPHLSCMNELTKIADLTNPANWYPEARKITRKIIYHAGPTNSGKTYHAMQCFLSANTGVYCSPLKLLAHEIFEKSNSLGTACDLVTGEEIRQSAITEVKIGSCDRVLSRSTSTHVSNTVEMTKLHVYYDVAIIDEIQMLRDRQRGWAWTRAFLGLKAGEIHVCGEASGIYLIKELTIMCGDEFELHEYDRLTTLEVQESSLGSLNNVMPGDCIVCFSKADIMFVAKTIEDLGHEVAVIYGDLPPKTKLAMAAKFNDPHHPCNIMIATDAIGMGMNLSINRIVFYSVRRISNKEDNQTVYDVIDVPTALQISGRAGRYNSHYPTGHVTTVTDRDLVTLRRILSCSPDVIEQAGLKPTSEQIAMFSYNLPNYNLANIMDIFINICSVDSSLYFICHLDDFQFLANIIQHIPLELNERYVYCCSPVNKKMGFVCGMFLKFVRKYSEGKVVTANLIKESLNWPISTPTSIKELSALEQAFEVCELYAWYSYRFAESYSDAEEVLAIRNEINDHITDGINNVVKLYGESSSADNPHIVGKSMKDKMENIRKIRSEKKEKKTAVNEFHQRGKASLTDRLLATRLLSPEDYQKLRKEWSDECNHKNQKRKSVQSKK